MYSKVCDQAFQRAFPADDAYRLLELHAGLDDLISDLFWHHIIDTDQQSQRSRRWALLERIEQLLTFGENLVGIAVDQLAHLSGNQIAPGFRQQLLAETLFQRPQLGADGRSGESQLLARARQAARTDHGPEVQEMLVVEASDHSHGESPQGAVR